jgi:phosphomethylpyrimidine synthase
MIKENMEKQLEYCDEAPFYTLGPLTTDIAPVTTTLPLPSDRDWLRMRNVVLRHPKEHLGLPNKKT